MNRYVIIVIGWWLMVIGAKAQINPEIEALMAYVDSMKNEKTYINPSAQMSFGVGRYGLECQGRISFQHSYTDGLPDNFIGASPETISIGKQKIAEMLERVLQTLDRLSRKSIEATHWEIHGQNADTLNYAIYLRPGSSMFSLRNSTNSRYSPSAAFGGEYINMSYTAARDIPYYPLRNYTRDEETGRNIVSVDSSVVASQFVASASLRYTYYLDSAFVNDPNERGVQLEATPFHADAYCDAVMNVFNRSGVTMRKVHYYSMKGEVKDYTRSIHYAEARQTNFTQKKPRIQEGDTYGLHYIIQSKEVAEAVMRDYWKATIDYMMTHPHESCYANNPNRWSFDERPQIIFDGKLASREYPTEWDGSECDMFDVRTAYSMGYYHILLLKTDGYRLYNLPEGWETIRDYDNGVVTHYEEDRE